MPLFATSFEGLELVLRVGKAGSVIRIMTVYRPPSTGRKSVSFQTIIDEFSIVLDHHVIRCDLVTGKQKRPRRQIRYRKYTTIDNAKLVSDLRNSELFNNPKDGVDELSTQYNFTIAGFIDSHARLITRVINIRPKTSSYNSEFSDAKRQLRRCERRWRQTRLLVHRDIYTSLQDVYR